MRTLKTARRIDSEHNVNLANRRNWYAEAEATDTTQTTDTKTETKTKADDAEKPTILQSHMDKVMGNTRKEATDAAIKKMVADLGYDPNDPKAIETIKGMLNVAKQAEDAKKSAETLAQEKITQLEKERDAAKAEREAFTQERLLEKRDNGIVKAFQAAKANNADDLLILMNAKKPELVKAVLKDDGTVDEAAMTKLVTAAKTDYKSSFVGTGYGSPSNAGAKASHDSKVQLKTKVQA